MAHVTILGAGDMGSALVTPLSRNGHHVRLWGTEYDADIIHALRAGLAHPRLNVTLPSGVAIFSASESAAALHGVDVAVVAVTSDAVRSVVRRLESDVASVRAIVTVAKGFDAGADGQGVQLLPATIAEFTGAPVVAVGGPSKANEVAIGLPTMVVFGSEDEAALALARELFCTSEYRIEPTVDLIGLEVVAAMKNAYAIALGVADGLEARTHRPHHNLRAALFPPAIAEMGELARIMGGHAETAYGLAGLGDLQVTITAGRNRLLGERIGQGQRPRDAVQTLARGGTTIEGFAAAEFGHRLCDRAVARGESPPRGLPLLDALWRILYRDADPKQTLWDAL